MHDVGEDLVAPAARGRLGGSFQLEFQLSSRGVVGGGLAVRRRVLLTENELGSPVTDPKEFLQALEVGAGALVQLVRVIPKQLGVPQLLLFINKKHNPADQL